MATGILIGSVIHPLLHPITEHPIPVFGPKDHGITFRPGDGYNKKRVNPIELGVFHWTGSENSVETMARVLRKRKLGVEFAIDPYGCLYQFCDPVEVDTADAGIANSRSWGVEIVNAGIRRASTLWREPRYRKVKMGPRESYLASIHGRKVKCWNFYPAQTLTALALNKVMTKAIDSYPSHVNTDEGVFPPAAIKGLTTNPVRGAVGHFQISHKKLDPGTALLHDLKLFMESGSVPTACIS